MKRRNLLKLTIIKTLLIIAIIPIGYYIVYLVTMHALYTMGANATFKNSENCKLFKDSYITEMKKPKNGNHFTIIEQAKKQSCTK